MDEKLTPADSLCALVKAPGQLTEEILLKGVFTVEVLDETGKLVRRETFRNTVVTQGKNDLLDKYLSGSSYTAAFYIGLISSASYSAISATDTAASHSGWVEAGATHDPTYTGARPTCSFASASAGSKALASAASYTITGNGSSATIKGAFLQTASAVDSTSGILLSAGLFTGGDLTVLTGYIVNVSWSLAV